MPQDDEELLDVEDCSSDAEDYFQPKRPRTDSHHQVRSTSAEPVPPPAHQQPKPLTSFFIKDILSGNKAAAQAAAQRAAQQAAMSSLAAIVRPWDSPNGTPPPRRPRSTDEDSVSESDSPESPASTAAAALLHRRHQAALAAAARRQAGGADPQNADSSPLDALFEMTSKTFETLEHVDRAALGEWKPFSPSAVLVRLCPVAFHGWSPRLGLGCCPRGRENSVDFCQTAQSRRTVLGVGTDDQFHLVKVTGELANLRGIYSRVVSDWRSSYAYQCCLLGCI